MIRHDYSQPYVTRDEYLEVKGVDLNIELQDDDNHSNKVNRFIQDITNFVLDHLVMEYNCNELNRQFNEFEDLAEFRRVRFHYGMLEEIEYVLSNGLIQLDSGINRETGSITDFSGLVIGSSALKQFRLGGFCNKQEGTGHRGDLSPKDMPTIEELVLELGKKVDKVDGKGLSANDYTTADKTLLRSVAQELNDKVDKEEGKKLTTNDFTDAYKNKVDGIEAGAQVNKIEHIRVNNDELPISGKTVNIDATPIIAAKEDVANKVTTISDESTDSQYPSAKCVYDNFQEQKAEINGKARTIVIAYLQSVPAAGNARFYKKPDGTHFADDAEFNSYVSGRSLCNSSFNSQENKIEFSPSLFYLIDQTATVFKLSDFGTYFKTGDNVYIIETQDDQNVNLPDRWIQITPGKINFFKLETAKVDLSNYPTLNGDNVFTGTNTFKREINLKNQNDVAKWNIYLNDNDLMFRWNTGTSNPTRFLLRDTIAYTCHLLPTVDNSYDIGSNSYKYKNLYLSGKFIGTQTNGENFLEVGSFYGGYDSNGGVEFGLPNHCLKFYTGGIRVNDTLLRPQSNNTTDLGNSDNRFKKLYLSDTAYTADIAMGNGSRIYNNNLAINNGTADIFKIDSVNGEIKTYYTIFPFTSGGASLGKSNSPFANLHLSGTAYIGSGSELTQAADGSFQVTLSADGKAFKPSWDGHYNLGLSGYRWKDGHFSGQVYAENTYNQINVSDIDQTGGTVTLTEAQVTLLTNGKMTQFNGDILGLSNPVCVGAISSSATYYTLFFIGAMPGRMYSFRQQCNLLRKSDRVLIGGSYGSIELNGNGFPFVGGKQIPTYPTSPTEDKVLIYGTDNNLKWGDGIYNVIDASDITNNTLTNDQFALITNGRPTLIKGTFRGYKNPVLFSGDSAIRGIVIAETNISCYVIDPNSKILNIESNTNKRVQLNSIQNFNGKEVPAYPSAPLEKMFLAYDTDDTIKWVSETQSQIDVPANQAYTCIVQGALVNINGKNLTSFTSTYVTVGGYTAIKILKNGNKLTESEAATYMQAQTGSSFVPKYDLDKPQYTYFIFATGSIYKVQWDSTNGLLLYYVNQLAFNSQINTLRSQMGCTEISAPVSSTVMTQQEFEAIHDGKAHFIASWGQKYDVFVFPNHAQDSQDGKYVFGVAYQTDNGGEFEFCSLIVDSQNLTYSFSSSPLYFGEDGKVNYGGPSSSYEIATRGNVTTAIDSAFEGGKIAYKTIGTESGEVKTNSSSGVSYTIPEAYRGYAGTLNITWRVGTTTINNTSYTSVLPIPPIRIAALGTLNVIDIDDSFYLEIVKSSVSFSIIVRRHSDDAVVSTGELYIWLS